MARRIQGSGVSWYGSSVTAQGQVWCTYCCWEYAKNPSLINERLSSPGVGTFGDHANHLHCCRCGNDRSKQHAQCGKCKKESKQGQITKCHVKIGGLYDAIFDLCDDCKGSVMDAVKEAIAPIQKNENPGRSIII